MKGSDSDPSKAKPKDSDKIQESSGDKGSKSEDAVRTGMATSSQLLARCTHQSLSDKKTKGAVDEQVVPMNNERFTVPEALLRPSNVGVYQAGIPEAINQVISMLLNLTIHVLTCFTGN